MQKFFKLLGCFVILISASCNLQREKKQEKISDIEVPLPKDPFHRLCQYWEVTDAESPTLRDIYDNQTEGVYNYPGIAFMTDSTFLEDPRSEMRYGKFSYKGRVINATFDDGTKAVYTIMDVEGNSMTLERKEKNHTTILHCKGEGIYWPDVSTNPYEKVNSLWMIKPARPETTEQLKTRLKGCVRFFQYYFMGEASAGSTDVDFLGLPCCFKWYQGAILVQGPGHLDKKWINCFYSGDQAMQARKMMEDTLVSNKYNWDTTKTNWLLQTADVLKQIYRKF